MINKSKEWAKVFTDEVRRGQDTDNPEGSRYIQISDTLAKDLILFLESIETTPVVYKHKQAGFRDKDGKREWYCE